MPKRDLKQLTMTFPGESPEEMKARNQAAIEKHIRERYPMTEEEAAWLPEGVRLARLVPCSECESCNLACEDHTCGWRFASSVCLKDLYSKEGKGEGGPDGRWCDHPAAGVGTNPQPPALVEGTTKVKALTVAEAGEPSLLKPEPVPRRVGKRQFRQDHPGVEILVAMSQGGIDRVKAMAILEHFGSVRAFERAPLRERLKVPRVGRALIKRFDYFMELPYREDGNGQS